MRARWLALSLTLLLAACGLPGNVVVLMPDDDGHVGSVVVANAAGRTELDKPLTAVGLRAGTAPGAPVATTQEEVDQVFGAAVAARPQASTVFIVYFVQGETTLDPASRSDLAAAVDRAKAVPNADISVVGHADATGSAQLNMALSLRRAEAIRAALVAAGLPTALIEISHHGANNPLVPTPPGVAEPRNRRVEITIR